MDDVVHLLSRLVAIPSVNPMGRAVAGDEFLEGRMTDFLQGWFEALGVPCERTTIAPGRDNILARFVPERPSARLLWDAHQDTVPVDGMTVAPFGARVESGRMYGRGACDIKGGMAAMLVAFARLVRERPAGAAAVTMACTVDEEFTHIGSSALAANPPEVDLAIVAEPTKLDLVTTHKGAVRWKIRTTGVACHSSTPHLGSNAIYAMAPIVSALAEYAETLDSRTPDPILGTPTLSVGRIEGGQSVNVVPDWCTVEIDRRVIPGESPSDAVSGVRGFLTSRLGALDAVEFLPPWVKMPALSPCVPKEALDRLSGAVEAVAGRRPIETGVPYGTDAGPLGQAGVRCVVFGPGDIAQAHTKDEWIDLDELRTAAEIYYRMAMAFA